MSEHAVPSPEDGLSTEIREGRTRRGFLRSTAAATGLALGGAAVARAASPRTSGGFRASRASNGAIMMNRVGAQAAPQLPNLYPNWNATNFHQIQADENAHVQYLTRILGSAARPIPTFQNLEQPDVVTFAQTSFVLENTGVDAYLGAAPFFFNKPFLSAAGSILTVEARHSGYLGTLFNQTMDLFGQPFDSPPPLAALLGNAAPFIHDLNGGPPLTFDMTNLSTLNDIAILNVALALEYLEASYYNINVPKFFG